MGYSATVRGDAPYDVINLDFCDSIAGAPPQTRGSTLEAIRALLVVQRELRTEPWLLFITTRVDKEVVDVGVWQILVDVISGNIKSSETFVAALKNLGLEDPSQWKDDHGKFHRAFIIGLGKWLLGLTTSAAPHWRVELLSSYGYAILQPMDILSLSFRFEMVVEPLKDPAGLVAEAPRGTRKETELAAKLAADVAKCTDVDLELANDEQLRKDMVSQSGELLVQARYSIEKYSKWVEDGAPGQME